MSRTSSTFNVGSWRLSSLFQRSALDITDPLHRSAPPFMSITATSLVPVAEIEGIVEIMVSLLQHILDGRGGIMALDGCRYMVSCTYVYIWEKGKGLAMMISNLVSRN